MIKRLRLIRKYVVNFFENYEVVKGHIGIHNLLSSTVVKIYNVTFMGRLFNFCIPKVTPKSNVIEIIPKDARSLLLYNTFM